MIKNIYVINLDRNKNRLKRIDENLKKYNLSYKRFSAIDGSKLDYKDIIDNTTSYCRHLLCNKSIIGCAMSHIKLWGIIYCTFYLRDLLPSL